MKQLAESLAGELEMAPRPLDVPRRVFDLDSPPYLVGADVLAAVFGIGLSAVYKNAKRGVYDSFKVNPVLGPKCYSGVLLARWIKGEPLYVPSFGRKRS